MQLADKTRLQSLANAQQRVVISHPAPVLGEYILLGKTLGMWGAIAGANFGATADEIEATLSSASR